MVKLFCDEAAIADTAVAACAENSINDATAPYREAVISGTFAVPCGDALSKAPLRPKAK